MKNNKPGYIDADATVRKMVSEPLYALGDVNFDEEWFSVIARVVNQLIDSVKNAPTSDVEEVRHGRWKHIPGHTDPNGNEFYSCTYCEDHGNLTGDYHHPTVEVPYCWRCGAKMDLKGERNDEIQ